MSLKVTKLTVLFVFSFLLIEISSLSITYGQQSEQNFLFYGLINPYRIYQVRPDKQYILKLIPMHLPTEDYLNLPKTIKIEANSSENVRIQVISNNYILISVHHLDNSADITDQLSLYKINPNNYLFKKYLSSNKTNLPDIKTLLVLKDYNEINAQSIWAVSSYKTLITIVIIKKRQKKQEQQNLLQKPSFLIKIKNISEANGFFRQINLKFLQDYVQMTKISHLQIMHSSHGKFSIILGSQTILYTFILQSHKLNHISTLQINEVSIIQLGVSKQNIFWLLFSNTTLAIKQSNQKNNPKDICQINNIQSCKPFSDNLILCKINEQDYTLYDFNCKVKQSIRLDENIKNQNIRWTLIMNKLHNYSINENERQDVLFDHYVLQNFTLYHEKYADNILQNFLQENWGGQNNCLLHQLSHDLLTINIEFTKQKWRICRLTLKFQDSYLLQIDNQKQQSNYKAIVCRIKTTENQQSCYINELNIDKKLFFNKNYLYRVYLLQNQKQWKNVRFINVQQSQMNKFTRIVIFTFISIVVVLLIVLFVHCGKTMLVNLFIYYQIINRQPKYKYPLNRLLLKIKIKRFIKRGFMCYHNKGSKSEVSQTEEQVCCFCIEPINTLTKSIELYCGHQYHADCFQQWMRKEPLAKCPYCKRQFTQTAINNYKDQQHFKQLKASSQQYQI